LQKAIPGYHKHNIFRTEPGLSGRIKLAAISLGCSKNRIDTEEILGYLADKGFILTDHYRFADVILVNTCGFIDQAQQESINTILQVAENTGSNKPKIVAAGCLVEVFGNKIIKNVAAIDGAIGVHSYSSLDQFMKLLLSGKRTVIKKSPANMYQSLSSRVLTTPVHTASVKIADGCSNRCHYCLIPRIRGPYRSREPEEIVAEINDLLDRGTAEINLIAQDTTAYGSEKDSLPNLSGLIKKILKLDRTFRLRIMYTYPSRIDDQLIELIGSESRICNYLDIPIQHSSDQMLERMGRLYNRQQLTELLSTLRRRIPDIALRTTVMVGYPGETRSHFRDLLQFIEDNPFENLGAFTYSRQDGTIAGNINEQVPGRVAAKRYRELMLKQKRLARIVNKKYMGKQLDILVEGTSQFYGNWYYGRSQYQAPEVDGLVYFRSPVDLKPGIRILAKIDAVSPYNLLAYNMTTLEKKPD